MPDLATATPRFAMTHAESAGYFRTLFNPSMIAMYEVEGLNVPTLRSIAEVVHLEKTALTLDVIVQ